jgi:hypothetical protein
VSRTRWPIGGSPPLARGQPTDWPTFCESSKTACCLLTVQREIGPEKHLLALFRQQAQNEPRWRCPLRLLYLLLTLLVVAFIAVFPAQAQQGMTNTDIIKMQSAGLSESIILSSVNTQPAAYDTSTDGLLGLSGEGRNGP